MTIQTEIQRISGNISDALSALANKGVTVPSGSNSDDLADLIAAIEAGGGSVVKLTATASTNIEFGEIFGEGVYNYVYHNLGEIPNFFALFSKDVDVSITGKKYGKGFVLLCPDTSDTSSYLGMAAGKTSNSSTSWNKYTSTNGDYVITESRSGTNCAVYSVDTSKMYLEFHLSSGQQIAQTGKTYELVVAKL